MKLFIISLMAIAMLASCKKDEISAKTELSASRTKVTKSDSVSIHINFPPSGNICSKWTVSPSSGANFDSVYTMKSSVGLGFTQAGTYTITADLRTVNTNCIPSPGYDTCYTNKPSLEKHSIVIKVTN